MSKNERAKALFFEPVFRELFPKKFLTTILRICDKNFEQLHVSIDDEKMMAEEKLAIVLGTEGDGLADHTIADCDYTVKIPMTHGVDSLNVAAASAVAFWQLGMKCEQ